MRTQSSRRRPIVSVVLAALLWGSSGSAGAEQLLRWKLAGGESLAYQFTQTTQSETAGAGKPMRVGIDTAMTVRWKVDSIDDQRVASITQTIDSFRVTIRTDKLDPIVYDSTIKTPPPGPARQIAATVGKLLGASCVIRMTDRGEIASVEPSDEMKQAVAPGVAAGASGMLTPDGMTQILRQAAVLLPDKPVVEGAKWEVKQQVASPAGNVLLASQFSYAGVAELDGSVADKIGIETSFTLPSGSAEPASTLKLKEGKQTGTLWFDASAGRAVRSELSQRLVTERPYRDLSIRVESSSNLTVQRLP